MSRLSRSLILILACLFTAWSGAAWQTETFTGIYLQKAKIGYSISKVKESTPAKKVVESRTIIKSAMLGATLDMEMASLSTIDPQGRLLALQYEMVSGGRKLAVTARVEGRQVIAKSVSEGQTTDRTIPIPEGVTLMEEAEAQSISSDLKSGGERIVHVFDANSLTLQKVTIQHQGEKTIDVKGKSVKAIQLFIDDPRAPMTVYLNSAGSLLRAEGPMGMEMYPESKAEAMNMESHLSGSDGTADLANASSIGVDKPLTQTGLQLGVTLKLTGEGYQRLKSGPHQTVTPIAGGIQLKIHPLQMDTRSTTLKIGQIKEHLNWTEPGLRIPSRDARIASTARRVIGKETNVLKAAELMRLYVFRTINTNAGIGVMRDALEVMDTKEGVCRDHAVLLAALLRSVKIPTQVASGMVYDAGRFYYHAWVEVWDGKAWVGLDSTRPSPSLTAGHIKIASGSVETAFTSFLMDKTKIAVVKG